MLILICAIVFGGCGYILGSYLSLEDSRGNNNVGVTVSQGDMNTNQYNDAYSKGWLYWFTNWGSNHEGLQYINKYYYGRKYGSTFESQFAAFEAGYKDAFFHCNREDPDERYNSSIQKGYQEYFGE